MENCDQLLGYDRKQTHRTAPDFLAAAVAKMDVETASSANNVGWNPYLESDPEAERELMQLVAYILQQIFDLQVSLKMAHTLIHKFQKRGSA